jgi:hypothetical protein
MVLAFFGFLLVADRTSFRTLGQGPVIFIYLFSFSHVALSFAEKDPTCTSLERFFCDNALALVMKDPPICCD